MHQGIESFITIVAAACLLVAAAIAIELGAAIYRTRSRGIATRSSSTALFHKALAKFISYEGGMLIAAGMDLLMRYSHIKQLLHLTPLVDVPIVTCVVGFFLLVVEIWGLHESSDKDADKDVDRLADMAVRLLSDARFASKFRDVMTLTGQKTTDIPEDGKEENL